MHTRRGMHTHPSGVFKSRETEGRPCGRIKETSRNAYPVGVCIYPSGDLKVSPKGIPAPKGLVKKKKRLDLLVGMCAKVTFNFGLEQLKLGVNVRVMLLCAHRPLPTPKIRYTSS